MAQICPQCKTSNPDDATACAQCGTALPAAAPAAEPATPAAASTTVARPPGAAARRVASSGAVAEAARRAAAQRRAAEQAAQAAARPAAGAAGTAGAGRAGTTPRSPARTISAPINQALDRAGLPRFSTQRYLVIWLGFVVLLVAVILALVWLGASQARPTATVAPTAQPGNVLTSTTVVFTTTRGAFTLQLAGDDPTVQKTVRNFRDKVASGFYTGKIFHRVESWIVQGGAPNCDATTTSGCTALGAGMSAEYNDKPFTAGSVGMASQDKHALTVSADQWFITKQDAPSLTNNYPNFAKVVSGMDVVNQIVGCSPKAGGGSNDLDCSKADKILTATLTLK